jgi:hypothetical protein
VSEGGGGLPLFQSSHCYWGGIAYRTSENLAPTTTKINVEFSVIVFAKCEQWEITWVRLPEAAKSLSLSRNIPRYAAFK